jgi:hypothetical protein
MQSSQLATLDDEDKISAAALDHWRRSWRKAFSYQRFIRTTIESALHGPGRK